MRTCVSGRNGRRLSRALVGLAVLCGASSLASAQTTVTVNQPASQVVSATIRGGSYADNNDRSVLATRASDNLTDARRALLKFDTQNTIPAGSAVTSARLTVTVKSGGTAASRTIGAYQVSTSWTETEVTWNRRRVGSNWTTAGGDLGSKIASADVANAAGTKVTFDVTPLVKSAVSGSLGSSRYTRIALVDLDAANTQSARAFFTSQDTNVSVRPVLTVTYGGSATKPGPTPTPQPKPEPPPASGATLRVLHWNTHHGGVGSDGVLDQPRLMKWVAKFNADIISLQEVERYTGWGNVDGPAVLANLLEQYSGTKWYYRFATLAGGANGIGDLILSRLPIDADDTRLLTGGRSANTVTIQVNGRQVSFASTHLHPDSSSYRMQEIGELTAWHRGFGGQRIIAGDFNATYTSQENATMKQTHLDSWAVAQGNGTAVAYPGNPSGNTRNGRIDYIYYAQESTVLALKSSQVFDTRDANGVTPSDHKPLMSIFIVK
jgi:endonuclease/exonuclease/phosphatase family metal-dependent hydrolase